MRRGDASYSFSLAVPKATGLINVRVADGMTRGIVDATAGRAREREGGS